MIDCENLAIPAVKILRPKTHGDHRGHFTESYNQRTFAQLGIDVAFVQDNHTYSALKGTVRGLHFQTPPFAQAKLVRVLRGAILDIAVDLRHGSPTYGQHVSTEISASDRMQIFVPAGFAHGLVTLEPDTEVFYKVSNFYSPEHDAGLLWNDPALAIDWGISQTRAIISDKDKSLPRLAELPACFHYRPGDDA